MDINKLKAMVAEADLHQNEIQNRLCKLPLPLNSIICADNSEMLMTFPKDSVDLVVTSPPYDDLRTYGGHTWDFYGIAWLLKRVLKSGGVIVWIVNDKTDDGSETGSSMMQALHFKEIGLKLHDTMIYKKNGAPFPESTRYYPIWEYSFVFSKGSPRVFNPIRDRTNKCGGVVTMSRNERQPNGTMRRPEREFVRPDKGVRFNIWEYPVTYQRDAGEHPAPFPEKLAHDHILSWSNEGDIVLDPFNGSGTTTKMAKLCGRRYIGIDLKSEYCAIARRRLANV